MTLTGFIICLVIILACWLPVFFDEKSGKQTKKVESNEAYPTDEEIETMVPVSFKLDKVETWRYEEFCERHRKCVSGKNGAIGGGISVEFMPTGLGNIVHCKCRFCGKEEDITNSGNW